MNEYHYQQLIKLSSDEIKEFFLLYVGLDSFLKNIKITKLSKKEFVNKIPLLSKDVALLPEINVYRPFTFRLMVEENGTVKFILFELKTKDIIVIDENLMVKTFSFIDFSNDLPEGIVELLIDVSHNNVTREETYKNLFLLRDLKKPKGFEYHFAVGAGINHGYNMMTWNELERRFTNSIDGLFRKGVAKEMNDMSFNTNYGSFQIVKDIRYSDYKSILTDMVNGYTEPNIYDDTILLAVSKTVVYQSMKKNYQDSPSLLTFNYDDLIEKTVERVLGEDVNIVYKDNDYKTLPYTFTIIHNHGYLPKGEMPLLMSRFNSVVLTTEEYFKNYKTPSSFGYKKLYEHLDETTTFIGNSVNDYEEQKVIAAHFDAHPSSFHYWYGAIDKRKYESILYKTIFLIKNGIIPLWYNNHDDYKNELMQYSERLLRW